MSSSPFFQHVLCLVTNWKGVILMSEHPLNTVMKLDPPFMNILSSKRIER